MVDERLWNDEDDGKGPDKEGQEKKQEKYEKDKPIQVEDKTDLEYAAGQEEDEEGQDEEGGKKQGKEEKKPPKKEQQQQGKENEVRTEKGRRQGGWRRALLQFKRSQKLNGNVMRQLPVAGVGVRGCRCSRCVRASVALSRSPGAPLCHAGMHACPMPPCRHPQARSCACLAPAPLCVRFPHLLPYHTPPAPAQEDKAGSGEGDEEDEEGPINDDVDDRYEERNHAAPQAPEQELELPEELNLDLDKDADAAGDGPPEQEEEQEAQQQRGEEAAGGEEQQAEEEGPGKEVRAARAGLGWAWAPLLSDHAMHSFWHTACGTCAWGWLHGAQLSIGPAHCLHHLPSPLD